MTVDMSVKIGALTLANPVICAAGEHVLTAAGIRAALAQGVGAVIAKSINESRAAREQLAQTGYARLGADWREEPWFGRGGSVLCRSGLQPMESEAWIAEVAALDREARERGSLVAASLILADLGHAVRLAKQVEDAGVRLLEFNVGTPYGDEATHGGVTTERAAARVREQVAAVCAAVSIPVWVKLTGQSEDVAALAAAAREGGAQAVVMIGRMLGMLPDLESQRPLLGTHLGYGGPWALPLACHWLAKSRRRLGAGYPLVGTNGARDGLDVARMMLAGASAVEMCSAVMSGGFGVLGEAVAQLRDYLARKGIRAADLVGRTADAVQTFAEQSADADRWRGYVPAETLG